jgi:hypothetical protein
MENPDFFLYQYGFFYCILVIYKFVCYLNFNLKCQTLIS